MLKALVLKISIPLLLCFLIAINFGLQHIITGYVVGIQPRTIHGLIGIITAPFFHSDQYHLLGNLSVFWLLGILFFLKHSISKSSLILLSFVIMQGTMVWVLGRSANHIGLSGIIFSLFGYMIANLVLCFNWKNIGKLLISMIAVYYYAFLMPQLFNFNSHISFEGHISGFLTGILMAKIVLYADSNIQNRK